MKVINYVHIKNMYAHKDTFIEFSEGKNYIVGPIGSGKTEVLQAISFALFGTSALRDKSSSYKDIYVELGFNYRGETFVIKRRINDASLLILDITDNEFKEIVNSTSGVNQKIIALLGYNYDIFLLSNFCQQKKLSYFSELTPAKRLQYIDKISGIEEAKDLLKYLNSVKKELKSNITILKDVTIEPTLPTSVDLEFDYESNITTLNTKLNGINDLYNRYNEILKNVKPSRPVPTNPVPDYHFPFINISKEDLSNFNAYILELSQLTREIIEVESKIQDIPRCPSNLKRLSLEEINELINSHNLNNIKNISKDVQVECSVCKTVHSLDTLLDAPESSQVAFKLNDLYLAQTYLIEGYEAIKSHLTHELEVKIKSKESLIEAEPIKGLSSYRSPEELSVFIAQLNNRYAKYAEDLYEYTKYEDERSENIRLASELKQEIDTLISTQSEDIRLKDEYIKANTEKNIYVERLSLYIQAKEKLDKYTVELDTVSELIKDVTKISLDIKNQTIPLINYHASSFLNLISNGKMNTIDITEDYDLIVDGYKINVKSGGQQDLASLAFRLSLSQSIIQGLLPLFLADEIDSAGGENEANDIVQALDTISNNGFQIILVTHKNTTNLENINIIQL